MAASTAPALRWLCGQYKQQKPRTAIVAKVASQSEQANVRAEKVVKERAKKQEQVDAKKPEKRKAAKI